MKREQLFLYLLVLSLIGLVVMVALGGGLYYQQKPWFWQWQHRVFASLCHQNPDRSFWINGQPMAVCSRCFGIYTGFTLGWLFLPFKVFSSMNISASKKILLGTVFINFLDIIGNVLGFWENTLVSRLALGWLLGWAAALLFSGDFFKYKNKSKGNYYGRITATGIEQ